jgi:general nucleoside transport system permease protein
MASIASTRLAASAAPAGISGGGVRTIFLAVTSILFGIALFIAIREMGADTSTLLTFDATGTQGIPVAVVPFVTFALGSFVVNGVLSVGIALGWVPANDALNRFNRGWKIFNLALVIPAILVIVAAGGRTNVTVMFTESLRLSTPIIMGAMAGIWAERSGVTNIAIEGMMLTGACFGFLAYTLLGQSGLPREGSQVLGVVFAILAGGMMAALHAWLSLTFRTNQIVSGTVINILAIGLTSFLRRDVLVSADTARGTLQPLPIPVLSEIPVVGEIFFSGKPIFYLMFLLVIGTHVIMYYTRWGLRTRAVGENPHAADTLGINVLRNRWINVLISGMIAGLAGAWYTLETTGAFDDNMTAGQGFIALAAMIFGNWTPFGAAAGGLLFGFSVALGQRFQFLGVPIPPQFLQMVPYFITIVVLAGLIGKASPPKADGVPWEKE